MLRQWIVRFSIFFIAGLLAISEASAANSGYEGTVNNFGTSQKNHSDRIDQFLQKLFEQYQPNMDYPFLDLGCGYGQFCLGLLKQGVSKVYGLDLSQEHLDILCDNYQKSPLSDQKVCGLYPIRGDLLDPWVQDQLYEPLSGVLAISVFHFWDGKKIEAILSYLSHKIVPGGILVLKNHNEIQEYYAHAHTLQQQIIQTNLAGVPNEKVRDFVTEQFFSLLPKTLDFPDKKNCYASLKHFKKHDAEKRKLLYPCIIETPELGDGVFHLLFPEVLSELLEENGFEPPAIVRDSADPANYFLIAKKKEDMIVKETRFKH